MNAAVVILVLKVALIALEVIVRLLDPELMNAFLEKHNAIGMLHTHLMFSMPAAVVLFAMLYTGLRHVRFVHIGLGIAFLILWTGTFITGVFYLPHHEHVTLQAQE